ncbi:hypothetical protein [Variovorax sp. Sphag1AA]|uniref:hypothetical protein n=1 Tax=Variovorax sp. Sphag1AA TaxID=2587027 RepID=UPI00161BEB43|nr:hypothetical protein [Variovorax sp. Sphag1AA]MBB3176252.1 hypothetical protein [Variovorax sp. Sphag1AA]
MTVIAWDGCTLAADKRATDHRGRVSTVTKIMRAPCGALLAGSGKADTINELREWWLAGATPEAFPQSARASEAELWAIRPDGSLVQYVSGPYPVPLDDSTMVAGSGGEVARGVLHMGGNARQAVEAACMYRGDCGNGIDVLELHA